MRKKSKPLQRKSRSSTKPRRKRTSTTSSHDTSFWKRLQPATSLAVTVHVPKYDKTWIFKCSKQSLTKLLLSVHARLVSTYSGNHYSGPISWTESGTSSFVIDNTPSCSQLMEQDLKRAVRLLSEAESTKSSGLGEKICRQICKLLDVPLSFLSSKKILRVRILKEVTPKEEIERWSTWPKIEIRNLHSYGSTIDTSKWGGDGIATKSSTQEFRHACYHLFYAPAVAWNGDLVICCDDARRLTKLGRFGTMSVAEAWQSKKFQAIRDAHMKGVYPGICKNCDVWKQYPDVFYKWQYQRS